MAYNPSIHTATNKPIGLTNKPVDARTYYYDSVTFSYRPYTSTAEVLSYLVNSSDRVGHFSIVVGSTEYWFKDGVSDADLVVKSGYTLDVTIKIAANSDNPANIIMNTIYRVYGDNPKIITKCKTDTNKLVEFHDLQITYNYTTIGDTGGVGLVSIDVYGHIDETGTKFLDDTYLTIKG